MVKFRQKMNSHGKIYIVKPLRESGLTGVIEIQPNANAAVIYREGTDLEEVLASLQVITADLKNQLRSRRRK